MNVNEFQFKQCRYAISLCLLLTSLILYSQEDEGNIRGHFFASLNLKTGIGTVAYDSIRIENNHTATDVQIGYMLPSIGRVVHLGLGVGMAGYHNPARNTFPIEVKSKFTLLRQMKNLSIDCDIGYAIPLDETFQEGFTSSIGVTWNPGITKKRRIGLQVGYTLQEIRDAELVLISTGNVHRIIDNEIAHFLYLGICYSLW